MADRTETAKVPSFGKMLGHSIGAAALFVFAFLMGLTAWSAANDASYAEAALGGFLAISACVGVVLIWERGTKA